MKGIGGNARNLELGNITFLITQKNPLIKNPLISHADWRILGAVVQQCNFSNHCTQLDKSMGPGVFWQKPAITTSASLLFVSKQCVIEIPTVSKFKDALKLLVGRYQTCSVVCFFLVFFKH